MGNAGLIGISWYAAVAMKQLIKYWFVTSGEKKYQEFLLEQNWVESECL